MQDNLKQQVLNAFLLVMRPIVRILLRYGIGHREFVEVAKTAYVDVASSDFGLRGRPTNISRVAVMTGLTRKEVKRLRDKIASGDNTISVKTTPLADVLHHWHAQEEFTDSNGMPLPLPFSDGDISFSGLVRKHGGDIPAGAMRTEMKRVGAVVEDEYGRLAVTQAGFKPNSKHENLLTLLVHGAYALFSNIAHNTDSGRQDEIWAHRLTVTKVRRSSESAQLCRVAKDRIADFADSVDDIFMAYEALHNSDGDSSDSSDSSDSGDRDAVAVGVFYFQEQDSHAKYDW